MARYPSVEPQDYLFIGGPADGRMMNVMRPDRPVFVRGPDSRGPDIVRYRAGQFYVEGEVITVFVSEDLAAAGAFRRLINGYGKPLDRGRDWRSEADQIGKENEWLRARAAIDHAKFLAAVAQPTDEQRGYVPLIDPHAADDFEDDETKFVDQEGALDEDGVPVQSLREAVAQVAKFQAVKIEVAITHGPVSGACPDCKGTRIYLPLVGPAEPCRTCCPAATQP